MKAIAEKDLPIEAYHAREHVSHSKLRDFAKRGPRYYHARYVSKTAPADPDTQAFAFGRAAEDWLRFALDNDARHIAGYAVRPDGLDLRTKDGKAWQAENAGKTVLSGADEYACRMIAEHALGNSYVRESLKLSQAQTTYEGEIEGVLCQSRPDWSHENAIFDLKTTNDLEALLSGQRVVTYGYHSQAAMAMQLSGASSAALIVAEKSPPYRVVLASLDPELIEAGANWCSTQLAQLRTRTEKNEWPVVAEPWVTIRKPAWLRDEEEW